MNLLPIGRIAYANEDGFLPRISRPDAIAPWAEPLQTVCEAVRHALPKKVEAILLRGSIPRGTALAGASDLDLVIVHAGEIETEERARLSECGQAIAADFPDVTDVELLTVPETEFWSGRRQEWLRFILSHQGLTLHGTDLIARLPSPRLDRRAVAHDRPGARWMAQWEGRWRDARTEAERRDVCSWLMKRYVRAAFERIMFDLNGYTRDLYPAAEAVAERCPAGADVVWGACRLAVSPSPDIEVVRRAATAMQLLLDGSAIPRRQRVSPLPRP